MCALVVRIVNCETSGPRKQMAAGGVPKASLPHQQGFKKGTLTIPSRLARDSSQACFRDRAGLAHGQEEQILLDGRGQVQKRHVLADPRWRNMA